MNILVIHETEYIEKVVFEYQVIPELWASSGHNVYVIDFPTKLDKKSIFDLGTFKTKIIKNVKKANKKKGITLIRPGFIKLPVLSRVTAFVTHYFAIRRAIIDYKIDVIFMYSVPTNGLQAIKAARICNIPVYFRLLDVLSQLVPYKILAWPTHYLEKYVYKRVDWLTAITPKLTKYAIAMGANPKTASYLPSGSDADLFFFQAKDPVLMMSLGIKKSDRIITFAGTLYNFSGLDKVLNYFANNVYKFPYLKFLIIGHGEQEKVIKDIILQNHLEDKVIMTGFIDYEKLNNYLNLSDICINPFDINKITDIIFPGKIYQYLACEKPVIATKLPGVIEIFPDTKGKNNIYYYNYKRPSDFFEVLQSIKIKKIENLEPSLQDIAQTILSDLKKLI